MSVRPLRRVRPGVWRSRDGAWTFMRHESDPTPKRWYAYYGDDELPYRYDPPTTLRGTVEDVEENGAEMMQ